MPGITLSTPFPEDIPTYPLLTIDYALVKQNKQQEIDNLWHAATQLGFWYLKNHGIEEEVGHMFDMSAEIFELPLHEKMKYEQGDMGHSFGYKARGAIMTDKDGTADTIEFFNISQDDALSWPRLSRRAYPVTVQTHMSSVVHPFVQKSMDVNKTLLAVFEKLLGLPTGDLVVRHSQDEVSGSEARCTKTPPNQSTAGIGAHTDFGTLSFVHNRVGGLQVMPPGPGGWQYIKPIPGHAVCNIGDALSIFSGGILRSSVHRVMPPPGKQSCLERYSIVFFTRPSDVVELKPLTCRSAKIAAALANGPVGQYETGCTAGEWLARRIRNLRIKNRTSIKTWFAALGTEHQGIERSDSDTNTRVGEVPSGIIA